MCLYYLIKHANWDADELILKNIPYFLIIFYFRWYRSVFLNSSASQFYPTLRLRNFVMF